MNSSMTSDGITIVERFKKAMQTIRTENIANPEKADATIKSLCMHKFGLSLTELEIMVKGRDFWKIAVQKARHEHMLAQDKIALEAKADTLAQEMFG